MTIDEKLQSAKTLLQLHFGHEDFRTGQEDVIKDIFQGNNVLTIMPTGGGKSLCYQLPALCLDNITLVISPLIALMKDQVDSLIENGVSATFLNSSLSSSETQKRIEDIKNDKYKIVYIAPERFYNKDFVTLLKQIKIDLVAIDEAHCISEWGHDFRPSYMKIRDFIKMLDHPQVIALTATATPEVKEDIIKQLDLQNHKVHITGFNRPNLHYHVYKADNNQKLETTLQLVEEINGSGIIYASTRNKVDAITDALLEQNISALPYHAGMDDDARSNVQEKFMGGDTRIIVATNAFGMGIDKRDIRFVIHFDFPGTMEAYYQEAGRAGRDGEISHCVLFYHPADRYLQEFFIKGDNPPADAIKKIYQVLLSYDIDTIKTTYAELKSQIFADLPEMAIGTIVKILEKHKIVERPKEKTTDAFLQFLDEPNKIFEQISSRAKSQKILIDAIINIFGKNLQEGVQIKIDDILSNLEISKATLTKTFNTLKDKGLIEYEPPFRGTEIKILKRVETYELDDIINFDALKEKEENDYSKLDKIEMYALSHSCRREYILKYFGDDVRNIKCGACDYCNK